MKNNLVHSAYKSFKNISLLFIVVVDSLKLKSILKENYPFHYSKLKVLKP